MLLDLQSKQNTPDSNENNNWNRILQNMQEKFLLMVCQMNNEQRVIFAEHYGRSKLNHIIDNILDFKSETVHTQRMVKHLFTLPHELSHEYDIFFIV